MATNKLTIFAAEDDPDDLELIRAAIEESGIECELREFLNGQELMDGLIAADSKTDACSYPTDLVLLDVRMPEKDGIETLREIKYHPRFKFIPVIMLTGESADETIREAHHIGANAYIEKPKMVDELADFLTAVSIMWDRSTRPDAATQPPLKQKMTQFRPVNILLVEDDDDDAALSAAIFGDRYLVNRFRTVTCGSGMKAYLAREGRYQDQDRYPWPDLILMDLGLPDIDGIELIRWLKRNKESRAIPVVVITGNEDRMLQQVAIEAGAVLVKEKPLRFSDLVEVISVVSGMYLSIVKRVPRLPRLPRDPRCADT